MRNSQIILEKVRAARKLPPLPAVTLEVLRLLKDDQLSIERLIELIKQDPVLAATILKVVNSSFYGLPRRVTSLKEATTVVGLNTVKMLVLSLSLVETLKSGQLQHLDHIKFWRRSLFTAVSGLLLAKAVVPKMGEDAFVAGLLSDIGIVAAAQCAPEEYFPVLELWQPQRMPLLELENQMLGVNHAVLGQELLQTWRLPELYCQVVGAHAGRNPPNLNLGATALSRLVRSAAAIAELFCGDVPGAALPGVKAYCREQTGIDELVLETALVALNTNVKDLAALLSLPLGQDISYETIQAEAAAELDRLRQESARIDHTVTDETPEESSGERQ